MNTAKVLVFGSESIPRLWLVPIAGRMDSQAMPKKQTPPPFEPETGVALGTAGMLRNFAERNREFRRSCGLPEKEPLQNWQTNLDLLTSIANKLEDAAEFNAPEAWATVHLMYEAIEGIKSDGKDGGKYSRLAYAIGLVGEFRQIWCDADALSAKWHGPSPDRRRLDTLQALIHMLTRIDPNFAQIDLSELGEVFARGADDRKIVLELGTKYRALGMDSNRRAAQRVLGNVKKKTKAP